MFKAGQVVEITVFESEAENTYMNMTVVECNDGLLKVRQFNDPKQETVYNMRSSAFVKAKLQN